MSAIFTPVNQVKLTNVAIVRLKKGGKRFEVACYKNKINDYRNKLTKDLDEVLQIHSVFINVSKGQLAKKEDLISAFGTDKNDQIIIEILNKGEVQVSGKEREAQLDTSFREIATIVADKCVNPRTKLPYPVGMIEKAMSDIHFSVNLTKNAKQQALEVIKILEKQEQSMFPIARAQMRLLVESPTSSADLKKAILPFVSEIELDESSSTANNNNDTKLTILIDPGNFKQIHETVAKVSKNKGTVMTLSLKDVKDSSSSSSTSSHH